MGNVKISVLGYMENGHWVAHGLEMDVIGVGDSWEDALSELSDNIRAQIFFAKDLGDASLAFRAAPPHLFEEFKQARQAELCALTPLTRGATSGGADT